MKKDILKKGKLLYITSAYPPVKGGTSVVNYNLLSNFSENSFIVATIGRINTSKLLNQSDHDVRILLNKRNVPRFLIKIYEKIIIKELKNKIRILLEREKIEKVIIVYPSYFLTYSAFKVLRKMKIPYYIYLHDTLEPLKNAKDTSRINKFEKKIFERSEKIFVINDGMKKFYQTKGYNSHVLQHTFKPLNLFDIKNNKKIDKAFWGGAVYGINNKAFFRVIRALNNCGYDIVSTSTIVKRVLLKEKVDHILNQLFFKNYEDYVSEIQSSKFLILALNSHKECNVPFNELSTIFPTKTIEYLNSSTPIVLHCPKNYFLAKFFIENDCGFYIEDTSVDNMKEYFSAITQEEINIKVKNANNVAKQFTPKEVSNKFYNYLNND